MVEARDGIGWARLPLTRATWPQRNYLLLFWFGMAFLLAFDLLDGKSFNGDTDDLLRAIEVRRFLANGAWYDMSFPAVRMPEIYVTPWSRLVDLPYAGIALLLSPFAGLERATSLAFLVWPPVMALVYGGLVVAILRRLAPQAEDLPVSQLLGVLLMALYAVWEFSPGRIDHHNVQILLLLVLVYGVVRWDERGGLLAGIALPASVAVGLETLPVLAVGMLALAGAWAAGLSGAERVLRTTGWACLAATALLVAVQIPPDRWLVAQNDSWSAPYALALAAYGAVIAVVASALTRLRPGLARLLALGLPGCLALGGILTLYPGLLDGPYPMIDGLAKTYWYDRIYQERSAFNLLEIKDYRSILLLLAAILTASAASIGIVRRLRVGEGAVGIVLTLCWAAVLVTLFSNRFLRIATGIVPILLPIAVANVRHLAERSRPAAQAVLGVGACFALATVTAAAVTPSIAEDYDAFDQLIMDDCSASDFSALWAIGPGRILTPPGLGLQILSRDRPGLSVSSISFHRAAPAMGRLIALYMATDPERRRELVRDADYLALCRAPGLLDDHGRMPLFRALMHGEAVAGFEQAARSGNLVLYRIDHAALR